MKNQIIDYYYKMLRIQMVENSIADHYYDEVREMHTPIHLCNGQEAIAVGICDQLENEDVIFSTHRCHGHYLAKGGELKPMLAELFSKESGCCKGHGGSMHLTDKEHGIAVSSSIVAGNVSIATGYALGFKQQRKKQIAVTFFGDGASEEGSVYESICFAKLHSLPILYVCENNMYAISSGLEVREPLPNISDKFKSIIETKQVDGNDVIVVSKVAEEAIFRIRNGNGPVFLECKTYRLRDHHNIKTGVESGYRTQEEWDWWNENSPIKRLEKEMILKGWIDEAQKRKMAGMIQAEIDEAFLFAHDSGLPHADSLYRYLWG